MSKIICSPGSYVQGNGEMGRLADYAQFFGVSGAYLIVDRFINSNYHDLIVGSFEEKKMPYSVNEFGGECCMKEIRKHQEQLENACVVIGIGGGKTLDTSKAVAAVKQGESSGLAAAHAIHNGLTVLEECHHMLHGEKVAFGAVSQMVLENRPLEEIREIIAFCKEVGLPVTLKALGIDQVGDEKLMEAAKASCADNDTMGNMPFEVTPMDVFAAMKTADKLASE